MTETVYRGNEVILRLGGSIAHDELVQHLIVGIGEEYRLDIGIVHTHMLHAVLFLVATGQLMLFDVSLLVVVGMGTHHQTILCFPVHGLRINIITCSLMTAPEQCSHSDMMKNGEYRRMFF